MKEKREQFRVSIRRKMNEDLFQKTRKSSQTNQLFNNSDFPIQEYEQLQKNMNMPYCLAKLSEYLTSSNTLPQHAITALTNISSLIFEHFNDWIDDSSKLLVNLTYHQNGEQMLYMLQNSNFFNLNKLLSYNSSDLQDNMGMIIGNLFTELSEDDSKKLATNLSLIQHICVSYLDYGFNDHLNLQFLKIISFLLTKNYSEENLNQVVDTIGNIAQGTVEGEVLKQCFKTMRSVIQSPAIQKLELINQLDRHLIIDDCISVINEYTDQLTIKKRPLVFAAMKLINVMLESNNQLVKLLIDKYQIIKIFSRGLNCQQLYSDIQYIKFLYLGLINILECDLDNQFCFEDLVKQIQQMKKMNYNFPSIICTLFQVLINSKYQHASLMEFPIIQMLNQFYEADQLSIGRSAYLDSIYKALSIGETIYPGLYIGQFLKFNGEPIIMELQKSIIDENEMRILEEIISMCQYENDEFDQ